MHPVQQGFAKPTSMGLGRKQAKYKLSQCPQTPARLRSYSQPEWTESPRSSHYSFMGVFPLFKKKRKSYPRKLLKLILKGEKKAKEFFCTRSATSGVIILSWLKIHVTDGLKNSECSSLTHPTWNLGQRFPLHLDPLTPEQNQYTTGILLRLGRKCEEAGSVPLPSEYCAPRQDLRERQNLG